MNCIMVDFFLRILEKYKDKMTEQQFKSFRGQVLSGNVNPVRKGLAKVIKS